MKAGAEREETTARSEVRNGNFPTAKEHLLKASNYYWWKGWWDGARDAKERAFDAQAMQKQAAIFRAEKDEELARQRPNERQDKSPKHPRRTNAHRRIPI